MFHGPPAYTVAMARTDIAIVGGGIIGASLAEELARRGQRVCLIERGTVGQEASSAAAGILSAQMDVPTAGPFFDLCQAARRLYPQWIRRVERTAGQAVDYRVSGVLYLVSSAAQERRMAARARWQSRAGHRVERWSMAQVRRREPAVDGRFRSGFHFPLEGQVDNARLMPALARTCRASGVELHEHTTARRLLIRRGRVQGVATDRRTVVALVVVNTLGSWAAARRLGYPTVPVEPARGQIIAADSPVRLFRRPVMTDQAYVVQRADGRLLLGSTIERVGFDKSLTVEGLHAILCGAQRISSSLAESRFAGAWAGLRPYSGTGDPLMGRSAVQGLYLATGHFRHGILLAPVTARLMADLILTGRSSFDLSPFSPSRFS